MSQKQPGSESPCVTCPANGECPDSSTRGGVGYRPLSSLFDDGREPSEASDPFGWLFGEGVMILTIEMVDDPFESLRERLRRSGL